MERVWDRQHPLLELSPAELEARVRAAFPGAGVRSARRLDAGLRNTTYRMELTGAPSPLALRLYIADATACCREVAVLAGVGLSGTVPVPAVLHADGAAVPPYALLQWIEGEDLDEVLDSADAGTQLELAEACGSVLAKVHELHFSEAGFLGPALRVIAPLPAWSAYLGESLGGRAGERLGPELAGALRRVVEASGPEVERRLADAVLVQADFKPSNLLVCRTGAGSTVVGVLDWEFAFAGSRLFDFATFLRDEARRPPGFGEAFAAGYRRAGGDLPDDWRRAARLLDLVNLCQLLERGGIRQVEDVRRLIGESLTESGAMSS